MGFITQKWYRKAITDTEFLSRFISYYTALECLSPPLKTILGKKPLVKLFSEELQNGTLVFREVKDLRNSKNLSSVEKEVKKLTPKFPLYKDLIKDMEKA